MSRWLRGPAGWGLAWLALTATALWARPLLPVDETRYLSVAWEMWLRGDPLVPYLNGAPYSHKPPLLFWLIEFGWTLFGVSELWGRLVAPLFALAALFLTAALARRLWPDRPAVAAAAPWFLLGGAWWAAYGTLTMFDMPIACFALIGLLGMVEAAAGRAWRGWLLLAIGVAGGVLAKGPVILVFLLPAALLAPLWVSRVSRSWGRWYLSLGVSLVAGAALALVWALPAARAGGTEYGNAILWGQTSGRIVQSFAHRRELWFYAATLPAMLLPWPLWPRLWHGAWLAWRQRAPSPGARFIAVTVLPALLLLSLVSGKQPQYLMPLLPPLALALAATWDRAGQGTRRAALLPCALTAAVGVLLVSAVVYAGSDPAAAARLGAPAWLGEVSVWTGVAVVAAALVALGLNRLPALAALAAATVIVLHLGVQPAARRAFDLAPAAGELARFEQAGRPLARLGEYHGQFNFIARLRRPIQVLPPGQALEWAQAHPTGVLIQVTDKLPAEGPAPLFRQAYRGTTLALWDSAAIIARPALAALD